MNIRKTVPLLTVIAFGGISPALADCCSGIFDCAAAVVTDGLSCEIETIISTIKTLVSLTNNILHDIDGQTQAAENSARQSVTDAYNTMQSQSQQASADLAQAKSQADLLYQEETAIRALKGTSVDHVAKMQANSPTGTSPSGPNTHLATVNHAQDPQTAAQLSSGQSTSPLREVVRQRTATGTAAPPNNSAPSNSMQQSTVASLSKDVVSVESQKAPHGEYADAFSRGLKLITTFNATGAGDLSHVNQYLATALASEGPGVAAADTLAGAMRAPLNDIESELSSMLTNPLSAFDPSNAVDSIENSITANMSGNISQMIDDISNGPNQAFDAAGPTFDDLLSNAENAQAVVAAMDRLYKERSPGAASVLYALLPKQEYANVSTKATASSRIAAGFGQRVSFVKVKTNLAAARQKMLLSVRPLNVAPIHAAVAQFKAQRAQGKSAQAPSMLAMYRTNTTRQLDGYFAGKSPLAMATERDQLVAQARTKFASDPKTQSGVIGLINSEAQKQGAAMSAAVPGQRVTAASTGSAANNVSPTAAVAPHAAASPSAYSAKLPAALPATAPAAVSVAAPSNMASSQQKAASWGATPAWTPPAPANAPAATPAMTTSTAAAPHVLIAIKPAAALKAIQPVQRPVQQPASIQSAPSSMTAP